MKIFKFFICVLLFISCVKEPTKYSSTQTFSRKENPIPVHLKGITVEFDEEVMSPMQITRIDSVLVLTNIRTQNFLYKYNLNNGTKINESISHGSGPNEMLSVYRSQILDTTIWIIDQGRQRVLQYGLHDICFSDSPIPRKAIQLKDFPSNILVLSDYELVTTNRINSEKRFSFYDMQGVFLKAKGEFPNYGIELNPYEKAESFLCNLCLNSAKDKIFVSYMQTDLIEIYDINGDVLKRLHGPDLFYPEMIQKNAEDGSTRVLSMNGKTRHAYFSPITVNDEVWVLYSGKTLDVDDPTNFLINTIYVFDWDGKLQKIFELDTPIFAFTVDENRKIIYALSDSPEFHVVKFNY